MRTVADFVLCVLVGVFEEGLFRGIILMCILKKIGKTRRGVVCAVIFSSLIFGVVHVYSYLLGGSYDILGIIQAIIKILQTGLLGMLLAVIYIKTKNLWMTALVHMLNDFFAMFPSVFSGEAITGGYVSSGDEAMTMVISYIITLLLYAPTLFISIRCMKEIDIPEYGIYVEE